MSDSINNTFKIEKYEPKRGIERNSYDTMAGELRQLLIKSRALADCLQINIQQEIESALGKIITNSMLEDKGDLI